MQGGPHDESAEDDADGRVQHGAENTIPNDDLYGGEGGIPDAQEGDGVVVDRQEHMSAEVAQDCGESSGIVAVRHAEDLEGTLGSKNDTRARRVSGAQQAG